MNELYSTLDDCKINVVGADINTIDNNHILLDISLTATYDSGRILAIKLVEVDVAKFWDSRLEVYDDIISMSTKVDTPNGGLNIAKAFVQEIKRAKPKEMTISEIEELVGSPVKIINDKEK